MRFRDSGAASSALKATEEAGIVKIGGMDAKLALLTGALVNLWGSIWF